MSTRESILEALDARLATAFLPLEVDYARNRVLPSKIPDGGMAILRDGEPGEPEVILSPRAFIYAHAARIEILVQQGTGRETRMDEILAAIGATLAADRTLGGCCDWVEPEAPEPSDIPAEAGVPFRGVTLTLRLHYQTPDPLL